MIRPLRSSPRPGGSGLGSAQRVVVAMEVAAFTAPLLVVGASAARLADLPMASYLVLAVSLHVGLGVVLALRAPGGAAGGLGPANRVTLARATLVLPIAALIPWGTVLPQAGLWWLVGAGTLALVLDGVDGRVARATGSATSFGARFDMELDAFLLLALSVLLWLSGPLGAWVILIGLLRYLFVGMGRLWPVLSRELSESRRRKVICVVQGVALLVALGPVIPARGALGAALVGLTALVYSFAVDVVWLVRSSSD